MYDQIRRLALFLLTLFIIYFALLYIYEDIIDSSINYNILIGFLVMLGSIIILTIKIKYEHSKKKFSYFVYFFFALLGILFIGNLFLDDEIGLVVLSLLAVASLFERFKKVSFI